MPISEVILGDCMTFMATCKDKQFDLAICDPPYGINSANMQMGNAPNRKGREMNKEFTFLTILPAPLTTKSIEGSRLAPFLKWIFCYVLALIYLLWVN